MLVIDRAKDIIIIIAIVCLILNFVSILVTKFLGDSLMKKIIYALLILSYVLIIGFNVYLLFEVNTIKENITSMQDDVSWCVQNGNKSIEWDCELDRRIQCLEGGTTYYDN